MIETKKTIFIPIFLLYVSVVFGGVSLNDISEFSEVKMSGDVVYSEYKDREVVGFEPVYVWKDVDVVTCGDELPKDEVLKYSHINGSLCWDDTINMRVLDEKQQTPVYEYGEIKKISVEGKNYDFDSKGCWVCPADELCCLSKADGYAENRGERFKCDSGGHCILRSGESGWVKDLSTNEITYYRSDVGSI